MPRSIGINDQQRSMDALVQDLARAGDNHRVHLRNNSTELYARPHSDNRLRNFLTGLKDIFGGRGQRRDALNWVRTNLEEKYANLRQGDIEFLFKKAGVDGNNITVGQLRTLNEEARRYNDGAPTVEDWDASAELNANMWHMLKAAQARDEQ